MSIERRDAIRALSERCDYWLLALGGSTSYNGCTGLSSGFSSATEMAKIRTFGLSGSLMGWAAGVPGRACMQIDTIRPSDVIASAKVGREAIFHGSVSSNRLRRQLRGDLDTIVGKALKKDSRERYGSVTAFESDLRRYLKHEPISAHPDTFFYRVRNTFAAIASPLVSYPSLCWRSSQALPRL